MILGGAQVRAQAFSVRVASGKRCTYTIAHDRRDEWEIVSGTFTTGPDTLTRERTLDRSNSGSPIDFSPGLKDIFISEPAQSRTERGAITQTS